MLGVVMLAQLALLAHILAGSAAFFVFLWVFAALVGNGPALPATGQGGRGHRLVGHISLSGVALLLLSWLSGGYYYLTVYGTNIKPLIKQGPFPWAHQVAMEAKEHIFLLLPFLALTITLSVYLLDHHPALKAPARAGAFLVAALSLTMALLGFVIRGGYS